MTDRTPVTTLRILTATTVALLALAAGACGAGDPAGDPPPANAVEEAAAAPGAAEAVEYEPAYPEEVSGEGLTEEDEAQQAVTHTHDGEAHTHEEGEESDHDDGSHDH